MVFAAVLLFSWGALSGGFGAYALLAAFQSESVFHAVQAGIALLIATVSVSAGLLALIVGRLGRGISPDVSAEREAGGLGSPSHRGVNADAHGPA